MPKPEADLKRKAKKYLDTVLGLISIAYPMGIGGTIGFPDRFGYLLDGVNPTAIPFAIEFKDPGKKLTDNQIRWRMKLINNGVHVLSPCYSVDEVREFIKKLKQI